MYAKYSNNVHKPVALEQNMLLRQTFIENKDAHDKKKTAMQDGKQFALTMVTRMK